MAGTVYQPKWSDIVPVLASEGIEFLLSAQGKVPLASCIGKKTCLFFSANWCRPCKAFTPQLVRLYHTLRKSLEIIFVSFDQDDAGFDEHFKCMPWLAVPFDTDRHRRLIDLYHVHRIPSLIPLSVDGSAVEEDLVGPIEDYGAEAFPFTRTRREELREIDRAKREGGKLEELLAHQGRDYVVSRDGRKVLVANLIGKTVGLYFGAHWCPPCRAFTEVLKDVYEELQNKECFDIVMVSTDRDRKEFDTNVSNMPWLAIPCEDRKRQDMCRIFNVKGILALVVIGADGKTVTLKGKGMVSSYGAKAFPFIEARMAEMEAFMLKDADGLPDQVKDGKHEHVLKLDRARAYVCDSCKKTGEVLGILL